MLVLLHFYRLGYTPFTLAMLFLLYDAAGILANLGGGWLATHLGIPRMLAVGLALQVGGLLMRSATDAGEKLFRWMTRFTGSKNAMNGVGFFLGGVLLQASGFHPALWLMAGLLALCLALTFALPAAREARPVIA